jgi:curli biogenesis system outer membrane secretion channel CsgG
MPSNLNWWFLALLCILTACAGSPSTDSSCRIAVWELENLGPAIGPGAEMSSMLTAKVIEGLQFKSPCGIVERQKLELALDELALGASQLSAESTRLKIGHIAGAHQMVFGAYQVFGARMRLDLRIVDVSTGMVLRTAEQEASSQEIVQWLQSARQAAEQLVDGWER